MVKRQVQMTQAVKNVAIYCRVSTADQDCARQERELTEYAQKAGFAIAGVFVEKASGMKSDRIERAKVEALAQARKIDYILVTELTRWSRSTTDLLSNLQELNARGVSILALTGPQFDLSTAQGKMIAGVLAVLAEFERDLTAERITSGLDNARAKGKRLGRQAGDNPSDKYAKTVLKHLEAGRSVRWIAKEMQIAPNTVQAIKRRSA